MVECECAPVGITDLPSSPGFNRYMVECEYLKWRLEQLEAAGFNRYMVECEFLFR